MCSLAKLQVNVTCECIIKEGGEGGLRDILGRGKYLVKSIENGQKIPTKFLKLESYAPALAAETDTTPSILLWGQHTTERGKVHLYE